MIIINSAEYVVGELQSEIGKIPPIFLPIGNKKLLALQLKFINRIFSNNEKIFVSLPLNYELDQHEILLLKKYSVTPIFVKNGITLGQALIYVINSIGIYNEPLYMLHGDTLIEDLFTDLDSVAVSNVNLNTFFYKSSSHLSSKLHDSSHKKDKKSVWCGFFSFSSIGLFLKCLAASLGDFNEAINLYDAQQSLHCKVVNLWHDAGHVNSYFNARCTITTQRAFNSLIIKDGTVFKSGEKSEKIISESLWFQKLPYNLKHYTPQFIRDGIKDGFPFYEIEFIPCLPLNELFVHARNSPLFWSHVFDLIFRFMKDARSSFPNTVAIKKQVELNSIYLFKEKTLSRLSDFASKICLDLNKPVLYNHHVLPSTLDILNICVQYTLNLPVVYTVLHGDLCLSNILYDSRIDNIKVIDPRGFNADSELSVYGNQLYDLAKLFHSIIGLYDFIIADLYELKKDDEMGYLLDFNLSGRFNEIKEVFLSKVFCHGISMKDIYAPTILLFLSMIPLHYDKPERQKAMLVNAYRLFFEFNKTIGD